MKLLIVFSINTELIADRILRVVIYQMIQHHAEDLEIARLKT